MSPGAVRIPGVMETKTENQRQLAESLIRSVGAEEAVYFAFQNQWMGVLAHLPSDAPTRHLRQQPVRLRADFASAADPVVRFGP